MRRSGSSSIMIWMWGTCFGVLSCAPDRPSWSGATLAVINATVVDIDDGSLREGRMIVVSGDTIIAVAADDPAALPADVPILDGTGLYALPGLWDSHVHAFGDEAVERVLPLFIAHGITSIRDMGAELDKLLAARARLASEPGHAAPRIIASGPLLAGRPLPWYGNLPLLVQSEDEARAAAARLADAGVDFLKIYEGLSPEVYAAIVAQAAESGVWFAGHVPADVGLSAVVKAGQRTVEHLALATLAAGCIDDGDEWFRRSIDARFQEGFDAYYDVMRDFWMSVEWERCEPEFTLLARNGGAFTPTLVMELNDASRIDPEALDLLTEGARQWCETVLGQIAAADESRREDVYAAALDALRRIRATDVPVLAGSDTPNNCLAPGASLIWELERLVEAGWTPIEALQAATVLPARIFGSADRLGRLAPGFAADIVLVADDPTVNLRAVGSPAGVIAAGKWYDRATLDAIRSRARRP